MLKTLTHILKGISPLQIKGSADIEVSSVTFSSKEVMPHSVFVAQQGVTVDGHTFIQSAIEKGAASVVCEKLPQELNPAVCYIQVENGSKALGIMASNFYGNPSKQLKLIGVTGTNGKTTIVTLLHNLFLNLGFKAGLLSTIVNKIGNKEIPSTHTTPDAVQLNALFAQMVAEGCEYCFMEVSSHSIVQERVAGLEFCGGIFTNLTHDHLDFHKTFQEYLNAKKRFFDTLPSTAFALTNKDDRNGLVMLQNSSAKKCTYSLQNMADFKCKILENTFQGLQLNINGQDVWTRLVGKFNAYNLLAIYGTAVLCGIDENEALTALSNLQAAEGRFEYIQENGITAIVDYAHTPDALKNVLQTINDVRTGQEQLIVVVGCGGNRDKTKRPEMASISAEMCDKLILTSDNPRNENPETILDEMEAGLNPVQRKKTLRISNRREAIKTACMLANPNDILLVAGKGHEKYQEINGVKEHFDDKEELHNALKNS